MQPNKNKYNKKRKNINLINDCFIFMHDLVNVAITKNIILIDFLKLNSIIGGSIGLKWQPKKVYI